MRNENCSCVKNWPNKRASNIAYLSYSFSIKKRFRLLNFDASLQNWRMTIDNVQTVLRSWLSVEVEGDMQWKTRITCMNNRLILFIAFTIAYTCLFKSDDVSSRWEKKHKCRYSEDLLKVIDLQIHAQSRLCPMNK